MKKRQSVMRIQYGKDKNYCTILDHVFFFQLRYFPFTFPQINLERAIECEIPKKLLPNDCYCYELNIQETAGIKCFQTRLTLVSEVILQNAPTWQKCERLRSTG